MSTTNDAELLQVLSELGITEDQLGLLSKQLNTADELRNYESPNTIQTPGGVVPAYGSIVSGMVKRYRGQKDYDKAMGDINAALERQRAGRQKFGEALLQPPQGAQPPVPGAATNPMSNVPLAQPAAAPPQPQPQGPMAPPMGQPPMAAAPPRPRPRALSPEAAAIIARLKSYGTPGGPSL